MKLNEAQQKAMTHRDGPMLVLAGPGSGKTAVITRRVFWLTTECRIPPGNILVITFTKAAAAEMQERYERLLTEQKGKGRQPLPGSVNFGTFHAVFFKILKYAYHYSAANIIKEEESYQLLTELIRQADLELDEEKDFIEEIKAEISRVKSERLPIGTYYSMNCPEETFRGIYRAYESELRKRRKIDFDDMLLLCYELLAERNDILTVWQQKYQYILIDEFQDINRIQYEIISMLAKPENNLFVVGDDDQSIYGFRGARPEIMLNFPKDYPEAGQVLLNRNYRSKGNIVQASLRLISHNRKRYEKAIEAVREAGAPVESACFPTQEEENEAIIELLRQHHRRGIPYAQMAVLFRTNTQARMLMGKLMAYGLPFRMRDAVPNLFEHWIARDVLAYFRVALGSRERGLVLRIMNRPKRYLSRELLQTPVVDFEEWKQAYRVQGKEWAVEHIRKLEYDFGLLARANPFAAITYLRRAVGYDDYLSEYAQFRRMRPEEFYDTLNELQESARGFSTFEEWFAYIEEYGRELQKQREQRQQTEELWQKDAVVLETMHSSKGLEYEVVILPEVNEGMTPYKRAVAPEEMEEERRMFYVAMTRAKQFLHLCSVKQLHGKKAELSRFLKELQIGRAELSAGMRVYHKTFGYGTVLGRMKGRVTVQFDDGKPPRLFAEGDYLTPMETETAGQ